MGKRSDFTRRKNDAYDTPGSAVRALLPHLAPMTRYAEPCAGNGSLIDHLEAHGHECVYACDIEPRRDDILTGDAIEIDLAVVADAALFITNPAWTRSVLHPIILALAAIRPTWLLFDADWIHTAQAAPYLPLLRRIVTVGRVKWIPDSPHAGKDNCAWHLFDMRGTERPIFVGRM